MRTFVACLLSLVCAAGGGQTFQISGKVVDARSGQPVARCVVQIIPTGQRNTSLSVTSGEDGRFVFAGLALGKFLLSASHRGYLTQSYQEHGMFSTAVAVGPALSSEDLLFQLTPQAIVYGIISDEAGEPIRRADVRLYAERGPDGARSQAAAQAASTDDLGKYELAEVAPGNYFLMVTAQPWYAHAGGLMQNMEPVASGAEQTPESSLNVAYPPTFYANATEADEATPIPLRGGEHLEMNMTLNPQHTVRLRIQVPREEKENFNLSLTRSVFGQPEQVPTLQAVQDGVLEVEGVLPGHYDATLTRYGGGDAPIGSATHFTADIADGASSLSTQDAEEEVTVTGKVSGLGGKVANPGITLVSRHLQRNYYAQIIHGEFSMKLPPGEYEVIGQMEQTYLARVASANAPVHGRMVEVKSGASPVLALTAGTGFGRIDGFVTAGNRRPGGVLVLLAPEDSKNNQVLFRRDQSNSDGSFSLYNVVPGRYRLLAIDQGWDLDWSDPEVLRGFTSKSIPLQVHEGETIERLVEVQHR